MKLNHLAVLLSTALLAACGGGKQDGIVQFNGSAPYTALGLAKDTRSYSTFCPGVCKEPMAVDTAVCPKKKTCGVQVKWSDKYTCGSCAGTGTCQACFVMEQLATGNCYNCKGQGQLIFAGQAPDCPNCKGQKTCPVCKGSKKCDMCGGDGKVSKEVVKAKTNNGVKKDDNELPPSDARPPAEKRDEPAKKDDAKKDDAPPAEKKDEKKEEKQ